MKNFECGKKRIIMLIGNSGAGKTTLCQRMNNEELKYQKTQTIQLLGNHIIDTPGEYLERKQFQGALTVTSYDADVLIFVQDATAEDTMFPPAFVSIFTKPVLGVVTKCDIAKPEDVLKAEGFLKLAGVSKVFFTSSVTGEGVSDIMEYLGYI